MSITSQCQALKASDQKRCTYNAKADGACGIKSHRDQVLAKAKDKDKAKAKVTKVAEVAEVALVPVATVKTDVYVPIVIQALSLVMEQNKPSIIKKIKTKLTKGPTKKDGPGHIYMYHLKNDVRKDYRKIGMTVQLPEKRVGQWGGVLDFSRRCKRHKMAEVLIHWYLNYVRVERWNMNTKSDDSKEYLTLMYGSGKFVQDANYVKYEEKLRNKKESFFKEAKKLRSERNIEWFVGQEAFLKNVVNAVVNAINYAYIKEEWPEWIKV